MYIPFSFSATAGPATVPVYSWSFFQNLGSNAGTDVWFIDPTGNLNGITLINTQSGTRQIGGVISSYFAPWLATAARTWPEGGAPQITSVVGDMIYPIGNVKNLSLGNFSIDGNTRRYFRVRYTGQNGEPITSGCVGGPSGLGLNDFADIGPMTIVNPNNELIYTPTITWGSTGCAGSTSTTYQYGVKPFT
jgi:hypothetical protein